jgi:hypothetical protein
VLGAAGKTEPTQENIQDWLELDEGDQHFSFCQGKICCSDFFYLISSALPILLNFPFICFLGTFVFQRYLSFSSLI